MAAPSTVDLPGSCLAIESGRAIAVLSEATVAAAGGVLLWVQQQGVELVAVAIDGDPTRLSAWLAGFASPPRALGLRGRNLIEPGPIGLRPAPDPPEIPGELDVAGVDVVVEDGVVRAEVLGLEVARVVVAGDGSTGIEVGVGRFDRAAHKVMTATQPASRTLADVVASVADSRRAGRPAHQFNRLCRERWLRTTMVSDPAVVGLATLHAVEPIPARHGLRDVVPAPAIGVDPEGAAVLVMASLGADPGLAVSTSAVAWRERPDRIVVALPGRDHLAPVIALLAALGPPTDVVDIESPWA